MSPSRLRATVIAERAAWIRQMVDRLRLLPLDTFAIFQSDPRNVAAAESYLRRALEALLDLGRHVLARGFGQAVVEYKDVARALVQAGVLGKQPGTLLRQLAGYRNAWSIFITKFQIASFTRFARIRSVIWKLSWARSWIGSMPTRRESIEVCEKCLYPPFPYKTSFSLVGEGVRMGGSRTRISSASE